jgi:FSR family fosmidomycin resistance protein-like MFS transporter
MSQIADRVTAPDATGASHALTLVRYWTIVGTHVVVDIYPIIFSALMHVLRADLGLTKTQVMIIYALTPLFSGPPQIFFAWLGDRFDTRVFGPLGLLVGGLCISCIGFAENFWQLIALEVIGVMGIGAYHPIAVALAGQLGGRAIRHGRALAVSIFFTAGMLGHSLGPLLASQMNFHFGLESLVWLIIPCLIAVVALVKLTANVPHRDENHRETHANFSSKEKGLRWFAVSLLAVQNALRFTSNVSLIVIANLWAGSIILDDPDRASILASNVLVAITIGMGISSLIAGRLIRTGHEKWPIVITTLLGSFIAASAGFVGREAGPWAVYAASALSAVGFASVIPTCIATAQRLLPSHTGFVSSLMMGFGWGISAISAWVVPNIFVGAELENVAEIPTRQVDMGYVWIAGLIFTAGLLCLAIPSRLLKDSAREAGTEGDPEHVENLSTDPEP